MDYLSIAVGALTGYTIGALLIVVANWLVWRLWGEQ
jgi:hypothetical protein